MALFFGFQLTRGPSFREEQRRVSTSWFLLKYGSLDDDGIRRYLRKKGVAPTDAAVADSRRLFDGLADGSLFIAPHDAALMSNAADLATEHGESFLARAWVVCRTQGAMPTCDEPIVIVSGPGQPRDERGGLEDAGVIVCPLAPTHVLAMFRADLAARLGLEGWREGRVHVDELDHVEDAEICREVLANTPMGL